MKRALSHWRALALVAAIAVGVIALLSATGSTVSESEPLSLQQVSKPLAGAPPVLAQLRGRVNELAGGGSKAFDSQLRALRGHPVVVNLWASWCDPCRRELPFLQRAAVAQGAEVAFLGINVEDATDAAKELARRYPMPYPSFEDPRGKIAGRYKARGLPATAFYDKAGKLVILHQGVFASQQTFDEALRRYALQ